MHPIRRTFAFCRQAGLHRSIGCANARGRRWRRGLPSGKRSIMHCCAHYFWALGLMLYATRLTRMLDRQDEDERVLMLHGIPPTRAQSIRKWIKSWLIEGIATGLVAWAISAPLIVEHFDQVNPWAIPAGM